MSVAKKVGLALGSLVLSVFLVVTIMLFSITQITSYETLRPLAINIAEKSITENMSNEQISAMYTDLSTYCEVTGNESVLLPVGQEMQVLPVACDSVRNATPSTINSVFPFPVALTPEESELVYKNLTAQCNVTGSKLAYFTANVNNNQQISNLTLNCSAVKNTKPEDVGKLFGESVFDRLYYTDPGCSYPDCFLKPKYGVQNFTVYLSSKAHDFYQLMFYVSLGITVLIAIGLIALGKSWTTIAKNFGISLIIAGIPVFGISMIKSNIPQEVAGMIGSTADMMFQQLSSNFLYIFVIGIVLLIIGLVGDRFFKKEEE
jgi:hypothetical protein